MTEEPTIVSIHHAINDRSINQSKMRKVNKSVHPTYSNDTSRWKAYRYLLASGRDFVNKYLKKLTKRESAADFNIRREITYCPSHAKASLIDVRNSIFERSNEIHRIGGDETYQQAIKGNVDNKNSSMNHFMGTVVLEELLAMRRVGICIDKPQLPLIKTKQDTANQRPYLYVYQAENIRNWYEEDGELVSLILRDYKYSNDNLGMPLDYEETYRWYQLGDGVAVRFYNEVGEEVSQPVRLELDHIPFAMLEISHSLLVDIIDYQIALLNIESSDVNYIIKGNFPFYVEQISGANDAAFLKHFTDDEDGDSKNKKEVEAGSFHGRYYPKGNERPGFIHPSSEPLEASMTKQDKMKKDIRSLINLALNTIEPKFSSAESKQQDEKGLEAGLAFIGQELERGERLIARTWSAFQGSKEVATIKYPRRYSLKTEKERQEEIDKLIETLPKVPSLSYQKEVAKEIVDLQLGHKTANDKLKEIMSEIDQAKIIAIDPQVIRSDFEAGFLSTETAAKARLYPAGEDLEQAKEDHAERAKRILEAQTSARGVDDLSNDPDSPVKEKKQSQSADVSDDSSKGVRGDGNNN